MYEVGEGRMLAGEGRGRILFVTHVWVHQSQRRQQWATEAMVREGTRRGAREIHLIVQDAGAIDAYGRMGMAQATEQQVQNEHTAYRPDARQGERYMYGGMGEMRKAAQEKGVAVGVAGGRRLINKEKCAQRGGNGTRKHT